jgi:hypothetical protein
MTETNGQATREIEVASTPMERQEVLSAMAAQGWKVRDTNRGPYWILTTENGLVLSEDEAVDRYCAINCIHIPAKTCADPVAELRQAAGDLVVSDVVANAVANTSNSDLEFAALRKISDANKLVREKEKVYEARKDEASKAKKELEASQERLSKIIEDVTTGETMPLFDPPDAAHAACATVPTSELPEDTDDSWRAIGMEEVLAGIKPASIIQALAEAGITTIGAYADYRAKNKLTDVAGIGESKAAKIEAAEAAFWERWKQAQQQAQIQEMTEAPTLEQAQTLEEAMQVIERTETPQAVEAEKEVALAQV